MCMEVNEVGNHGEWICAANGSGKVGTGSRAARVALYNDIQLKDFGEAEYASKVPR